LSLLVGRSNINSEDLNNKTESSIGSSALQRAIERNRLKQLEKTQKENGSDFLNNLSDKGINLPQGPINRPSISIEEKLKQLKAPLTPNLILQPSRQVPSSPVQTTSSPYSSERGLDVNKLTIPNLGLGGVKLAKSKWENFKANFLGYVVKLMWIFSIVLFLRLVFAERGVLEYYFRRKKVQEKMDTLDKQVYENKKLKKEIERIERDMTYQKSLVRNNLGFIAEDEFIIVLPEPKNKI
jgi:cell division protein FtsB